MSTTVIPVKGRLADGLTTTTTANTSVAVFAGNASRQALLFQNQSDTTMYINFGANAAANGTSILVAADGGFFTMGDGGFVDIQAMNVFCASSSKVFCAKEF